VIEIFISFSQIGKAARSVSFVEIFKVMMVRIRIRYASSRRPSEAQPSSEHLRCVPQFRNAVHPMVMLSRASFAAGPFVPPRRGRRPDNFRHLDVVQPKIIDHVVPLQSIHRQGHITSLAYGSYRLQRRVKAMKGQKPSSQWSIRNPVQGIPTSTLRQRLASRHTKQRRTTKPGEGPSASGPSAPETEATTRPSNRKRADGTREG